MAENGETSKDMMFTITHKRISIGSSSAEVSLLIDDVALNHVHSKLWQDNSGEFWVSDQDTVAGTWVNFAPVNIQGCKIQHQDIIHVGKHKFRFNIHNQISDGQPEITFH